jgi:hypothetical protein
MNHKASFPTELTSFVLLMSHSTNVNLCPNFSDNLQHGLAFQTHANVITRFFFPVNFLLLETANILQTAVIIKHIIIYVIILKMLMLK